MPLVIGLRNTAILLPPGWRFWRPDKLQAVLLHEVAHVRRQDSGTAFLSSLAFCFFWMHPLLYWLRQQLVALSEEACDEAALHLIRPEQYSQMLIEFAADVAAVRKRLVAVSSVAGRRSLLENRIERIFRFSSQTRKCSRLIQTLLVTAFFPVLYLTAAARLEQTPATESSTSGSAISIGTQAQADELESDLLSNPNNLNIRDALMAFYSNEGNYADFKKHQLWMIDHHPDVLSAAMIVYFDPNEPESSDDYKRVEAAWERALTTHANSAEVMYHAGLCLEQNDPQRALDLFQRAKSMLSSESNAQDRYLQAIALVYAAAVIADVKGSDPHYRVNLIAMTPIIAGALRAEIESSIDPRLLSRTGTTLVELGDDQENQIGLAFLQKANRSRSAQSPMARSSRIGKSGTYSASEHTEHDDR